MKRLTLLPLSALALFIFAAGWQMWANRRQLPQDKADEPLTEWSQPSPFKPDTANKYILHYSFVTPLKDTLAELRAVNLLALWNLVFDNERANQWRRICWRPGATRDADTLWVEDEDKAICLTPAPQRFDFSMPSTSEPDTSDCFVVHARFNVNEELDAAERAHTLWLSLARIVYWMGVATPDTILWRPAPSFEAQAADTLWVVTEGGQYVFEVENLLGHNVTSGEQIGKEGILKQLNAIIACDTVSLSPSFSHRLFFPKSGRPRPVLYTAAATATGALLLILYMACLVVRRRKRSKPTKGEILAAVDATPLHHTDIVKHLHELAGRGGMPTEDDWIGLERQLAASQPAFLPALRVLGEMSPKEWRTSLLVRCSFQPSEIAVLLVCSKQSVTNTRARLCAKLFALPPSTAAFDEKIRAL